MPEEILPNAVYSTLEAAKLLRINPQTVQLFVREGKIRGKSVGRKYLIPGKALLEFLGIDSEK